MFFSRRLNEETGKVEVWQCEWSNKGAEAAKKKYVKRIGYEDEIEFSHEEYCTADAVCWAPGRTIGNIAVNSKEIFGTFENKMGDDAVLPCQIIPSGKFRNGAKRWYCKTHQIHWGTKADLEAAQKSSEVHCGNHLMKMSYVINPFQVDFNEFEEIGVWCSLPPGLSSSEVQKVPPKVHVHKRFVGDQEKMIDRDFRAIVCSYNQDLGLFKNTEITKIQVTPPAAFEFVRAIEENRKMSCIHCKKCGYPHLDLGDFAKKAHRKHFCGNCGNDSIWSSEPIVSTPLMPLHDQFSNSNSYVNPNRTLCLDDFKGKKFEAWASTPAVVWTAHRPQERGIHVHVYEGGKRIVDDTFSTVVFDGKELDRKDLWKQMIENTVY